MVENITVTAAFAGGLISFFSPCVVVLVPAFLSNLAGVSLTEVEKDEATYRKTVLANTIFFIVGFTFVFVALGAFFGSITSVLPISQVFLQRIGGILIIAFGLFTLGLIRIPFLETERRFSVANLSTGIKGIRSALAGAAFGIAWTPCVSFILAGILTLAAVSGAIGQAAFLLLIYSAGLMLPFLLVGLFTGTAAKFLRSHARFVKYTNYVAGTVLIILGILIFTDNFTALVGRLFNLSPIQLEAL
jgi:cytochrome c-type biogenesis protein